MCTVHHLVNYLLLPFKSNCTRPAEKPGLQGRAREDSNSSSNEEGVEELKTEASYEETQLDSRTFTQVITRTPASNSEPIDYEKIVNNKYNPLTVNSVSDSYRSQQYGTGYRRVPQKLRFTHGTGK